MKYFITGGSGLLGRRIATVADDEDEIILSYNSNSIKNGIKCDITNKQDVDKVISKQKPDVIIHAAAMTNVDLCEDRIDDAYNINANATGYLAEAAENNNSKIIYVSTDFVFDGLEGKYKETDKVNPLGIYAKSKYEGEVQLQKYSTDWAIARVSVLYGWHERLNFTSWIVNELRNKNEINIVTDQINSPTYADNAAEAMFKLAQEDKNGIYHTAGNDYISRFDFTKKVAEVFNLDEDLINPTTSDNFVQKAPRPKDSSLNVNKIKKDVNFEMETCYESLERMKECENI